MLGINNFDDLKKRLKIFFIDVLIMIVATMVLVVALSKSKEGDSPPATVGDKQKIQSIPASPTKHEKAAAISKKAAAISKKAAVVSKKAAALACIKHYNNAAIYDSDICMSCVEVKDFSPQLLPMFNYWWFRIDGKMQNSFGTWEKNKAECRVDKNTHKIISFLFPDQFGPLKSDPPIYKPSSEIEIK